MQPKTDIHSHFAGVLPPEDLILLAQEHNLLVDVPTLKRTGIVDKNYNGSEILVNAMSEADLKKLAKGLALDPEKRSLFDELEVAYANKGFISKNPKMFAPVLERIAEGYSAQGVKYVELSSAGIINNPDQIRTIHGLLPELEGRTGVKIRFLAGFWRHSDHEWNMDEVDRVKAVLKSPYVVGIDVMGHEKNPIRYMKEPLQEIVRYAAQNIPGFAIRIHAGENPYYAANPDLIDDWTFSNPYEAIQIIDEARRAGNGQYLGSYGDQVQIRIGHGRYGMHPQTLDLMSKTGTISELCLTSNYLLNHADHFQGPFAEYTERDVAYTLGTDGYGTYGTSIPREYERAKSAGLNEQSEALLCRTEAHLIEFDEERLRKKAVSWSMYRSFQEARTGDPFDVLEEVKFSTPDGKARFSKAVDKKYRAIEKSLQGKRIQTDFMSIKNLLNARQMVLFSGASKGSWDRASNAQKEQAEQNLRTFVWGIAPQEHVIFTGGTDFGFEALVHKLLEERNSELPVQFKIPVVGAITLEANPDDIRECTLSHAMVLKCGDGYAMSWMDQPGALLDIVQENGGLIIYGGGGQTIRDMIVDSANRGLEANHQIILFSNIDGASKEFAGTYPDSAVSDGKELVERIRTFQVNGRASQDHKTGMFGKLFGNFYFPPGLYWE